MEVIKQLRQREIRELLAKRPIRTQQELATALRERGFRATQATISRDVAELGLVKASQEGVLTYVVPARVTEAESTGEERLRALLHDLPVDIREAGVVAITMCVGAALMWLAERWGPKDMDEQSLTYTGAAGIGVAQILALVPGISRSGVSISAGLFMGLTREAAARFSFMMAAPVVAGAGLWSARKLPDEPGFQLDLVLIGFVAAAISGLIAIKFMLAFLRRQPLNAFIVYRVVAAIVVFLVMLSPHGA